MPNTSQISPTVVSCYGGLVLNRDIFTMRPGEALQLQNFEVAMPLLVAWKKYLYLILIPHNN